MDSDPQEEEAIRPQEEEAVRSLRRSTRTCHACDWRPGGGGGRSKSLVVLCIIGNEIWEQEEREDGGTLEGDPGHHIHLLLPLLLPLLPLLLFLLPLLLLPVEDALLMRRLPPLPV